MKRPIIAAASADDIKEFAECIKWEMRYGDGINDDCFYDVYEKLCKTLYEAISELSDYELQRIKHDLCKVNKRYVEGINLFFKVVQSRSYNLNYNAKHYGAVLGKVRGDVIYACCEAILGSSRMRRLIDGYLNDYLDPDLDREVSTTVWFKVVRVCALEGIKITKPEQLLVAAVGLNPKFVKLGLGFYGVLSRPLPMLKKVVNNPVLNAFFKTDYWEEMKKGGEEEDDDEGWW